MKPAEMIGISLGDITGIGPEVVLKALKAEADRDGARYLIFGDAGCMQRLSLDLGIRLKLDAYREPDQRGRFLIHNSLSEVLPPELVPGSPASAQAALSWLAEGAQRCLRFELDALVTAPVNKQAILRSGQPFIGQTEFLSQLSGTPDTAMMLLGHDDRGRWLRVALATTHVPLKLVSAHLNQAKVTRAIELAAEACRDLGLPRQRIAVCGLNPHAGEGGELGNEEQTLIAPAIEALREKGLDVTGPFAADTLFHQVLHGHYDAVVAMYHDQGLVPLKMIAFETGVNWTLGLPFIRTSPDHGTAYNIAGQNKADPSSMIEAIRLAKQLARRRTQQPLATSSAR
jgi:4-phospho-D-threonate 3-dehydrogenase / 4-phospho-D-erythronate 3-dehydrogenase